MPRKTLSLAILLLASLSPARDKVESWIQVTSPHFVVVTDSSEKQGRRIADQFERMRSVFHAAFPKLQIDPGAPIIVIAVKDDKDFRALEPEAYLAKGSLKLGGLFLRAAERNYVLMRVDAEGEHPYSVVYHEYTHLLLSKSAEWMPLWMNEGLAEFYQNTDIHEKEASLGEPSTENILLLRQNRLLPLATLFTVDRKSPYYHEENKGSIFYAESWALMHYLEMNDFKQKAHRIGDYSALLAQKTDPVAAATQAFGDLKKLEVALEAYVHEGSFSYFKITTTTEVDDSVFKMQALPAAQVNAVRADFLACNERMSDAQALLDRVLQEDPNNVSAHETKGYIEFRQGHVDEAEKWYEQAVQLDSQSFLAHYYFASMAMNRARSPAEQEKVESSLRACIRLNPAFAPGYDRLAVFLAIHQKNLDDARMMELNAISLEPSNVGYRLNMANVLMSLQQASSAVDVLHAAAKVAKTAAESQMVDNALMQAQQFVAMQTRIAEQNRRFAEGQKEGAVANVGAPRLKTREFVARGPHRFAVGVLKSVHCDAATLDLTVSSKGKDVTLHSDNYYKISFTALGFQPSADLEPCKDLESKPAKVEYVESVNPSEAPQLLGVELHK